MGQGRMAESEYGRELCLSLTEKSRGEKMLNRESTQLKVEVVEKFGSKRALGKWEKVREKINAVRVSIRRILDRVKKHSLQFLMAKLGG